MDLKKTLAVTAILLSVGAVQAQDSVIILGKSSFNARCSLCHGDGAKGDGEMAGLFKVKPSDLTKLSERAGGSFPFSTVYKTIAKGMEAKGHGDSEMPIWGDYFIAEEHGDRLGSISDAEHIAQGRILSLVYYLESIQR
jgi:mono/diheme cytochrome c family protein